MKLASGKIMTVIVVMVLAGLLASCASTSSQPEKAATATPKTGFLTNYYEYLQPGPEGGAKMRWLKPGTDFGKYSKIMLDSVVFYFADDSDHKGVDGNEMKELSDGCNLKVVETLKGIYPIVAEPGPDVIRLRFAITDLKKSRPALSAVSTVVPIGLGINVLKKGATGSWTGSGATSAELMAIDSLTNAVIAVAQDSRSAAFTERFSEWGSTEEAFTFWAERIKLFLEQAHGTQ